jgi:hypothetical protein
LSKEKYNSQLWLLIFVGMRGRILTTFFVILGYAMFGQTCTFYLDADMDGFGDDNNFTVAPCSTPPPSTSTAAGDCDDTNAAIYPGAIEICNYLDDNCNGGEIDEFVQLNFYQDLDLDGFGDANVLILECFEQPGFVANMEDCDDNLVTYVDGDADGWGSLVLDPCGVGNNLDCNDMTSSVQEATLYFEDADGDGYGNPDMSIYLCEAQNGFIPDGTDCLDTDPNVYPNATDIPGNGIDENCDGADGVGVSEWMTEMIEIWPNPAQAIIHVEIPQSGNLVVTNLQGQWVMESKLFAGVNPIALELPSGIYWMIIKTSNYQHAKKIIVE